MVISYQSILFFVKTGQKPLRSFVKDKIILGVVTENKVLIKIEDDSEQMDSDVLESDDHEGFESNDMRMNVAPALTCSGYNHSNRSGMKDASVQTYPTYEVEKADNAKIKSHLKEKLECPVCSQIALPPIMQCRNGHITCNKCRLKVRDCPVCRETDTDIRNLYAEKSIHFLSIPCDYKQYGCKEEIQFSDKEMHENQCKYRPLTVHILNVRINLLQMMLSLM